MDRCSILFGSSSSSALVEVLSEKNIQDVYEHVSRLNGRLVTFEDRKVCWEEKMAEREGRKRGLRPRKRQAAEIMRASFDQSTDQAVSAITAPVALRLPETT